VAILMRQGHRRRELVGLGGFVLRRGDEATERRSDEGRCADGRVARVGVSGCGRMGEQMTQIWRGSEMRI